MEIGSLFEAAILNNHITAAVREIRLIGLVGNIAEIGYVYAWQEHRGIGYIHYARNIRGKSEKWNTQDSLLQHVD